MKVDLPYELPPDVLASLSEMAPRLPWLHTSVLEAIEAHAKSALESSEKRALTAARAMIERVSGHGELLAQLAEDGRCADAARFLPGSIVSEGMLHLAEQDAGRLGRLEVLEVRLGAALTRAKFQVPKKLDATRALAFAEKVLGTHPDVADSSPLPNEPQWRALLPFLPASTLHERFVRARFQWMGDDPCPREELERLSQDGSREATQVLHFLSFKEPDESRHPLAIRLAQQGDPWAALSIAQKLQAKAESWAAASLWFVRAARSPVDDPVVEATFSQKLDRDKAAVSALAMHAVGRSPLEPQVASELVSILESRWLSDTGRTPSVLDGPSERDLDKLARTFGLRDLRALLERVRAGTC
ncbi:MAG: hypothetical protein QM765_29835 [Myxococcales bacterium]